VLTQGYESRWGLMSKSANLFLGYIAKLLPVPICYPMQVLTNRMQTSATPLGPRGALREVINDSGVGGLFSGAESYFVLAIWPALEMFIFDQIKRSILLSRGLPLTAEIRGDLAFALGALGRFLATTIVFPTIRTRSLCQKGVYPSVPSALRGMYRDGGIALIYQGLAPELIRGVSYNAVIMSVKEITVVFCRQVLVALLLKQ
jgi:adenine nucleotide transporter 17